MIRLDNVNTSLEVVLSGAIAITQPQVTVCYSTKTSTAYTGAKTTIATNSTTNVTVVSAPAASAVVDVDYFSIYNRDTTSITFTVNYNVSSTRTVITRMTLLTLETAIYVHGHGWSCLDVNGNLKTATMTGAPSGAAGGDLSGTYPNPTVSKINGTAVGSISAFNAVTGYTASGATGTTSANIVFSESPTLTGAPIVNAAGNRFTINGTSDAVSPLLSTRNSASVTALDAGLGLVVAAADTGSAGFQFLAWGGQTNFLQCFSSGGTAATPAVTPASSNMAILSVLGYNGSAYTGSKAAVSMQSLNVWSLTDNSTRILLRATPSGSTTLTTSAIIFGDAVAIGSADPGGTAKLRISGTVSTSDPTSGQGPNWKLGAVTAGAVTVDLANYVEVEIGGTIYKLIKAT